MSLNRSLLALVGLGLIYATLLGNALIGYVNARRLYENDRMVIHTHEIIHSINLLHFRLMDAETAQRNYVSTGEASDLAAIGKSLTQTDTALQRLAEAIADTPRREQDIAALEKLVGQKLTAIRKVVNVRQAEGKEAAQAMLTAGESRRDSDTFRETIARMELEEKQVLADRQTLSEGSYRTAVVSGVMSSALGILLSIFASVLVWREMETRSQNAERLRTINDQLTTQAQQMAKFNDSLEVEIAERRRAEAALQEADRRKDQFLATLAHELRNPLSPLLSAAQLLTLEPGSSPETKEMSAVILRQVEQLKRLIDDLLDVSRISRGKLQLQLEPTAASESVALALEVSRNLIDFKHHKLHVALPEQPVMIRGDKVRLAQIIGNLLINAAKYTPPNGQIHLHLEVVGQYAVFRVRDSGIGIEPHMLQRIFDLFTQADSTNERTQGGLGIGLSLAKTLVELHGGQIHASSSGAGCGSEFVVSLPLASPSAQAKPASPAPPLLAVSGNVAIHRFLVVDDNESASHLLSKLLLKLGQEVRVAHSAETAIAIASQWQPHVLISDIAMPEVSGYELAERVCRLNEIPRPILIALTGYGQESDRQAALAAGFDEHLTKPIGMPALQELLERVNNRQHSAAVTS